MKTNKILILDEERFARICSAILELEGFAPEYLNISDDYESRIKRNKYNLVVTSYPYCCSINEKMQKNITLLILTDCLTNELIDFMEQFENIYCMVKPIDYEKFGGFVREAISNNNGRLGGCDIV